MANTFSTTKYFQIFILQYFAMAVNIKLLLSFLIVITLLAATKFSAAIFKFS